MTFSFLASFITVFYIQNRVYGRFFTNYHNCKTAYDSFNGIQVFQRYTTNYLVNRVAGSGFYRTVNGFSNLNFYLNFCTHVLTTHFNEDSGYYTVRYLVVGVVMNEFGRTNSRTFANDVRT